MCTFSGWTTTQHKYKLDPRFVLFSEWHATQLRRGCGGQSYMFQQILLDGIHVDGAICLCAVMHELDSIVGQTVKADM